MITIDNINYYTMSELSERVKLTQITLRTYRLKGRLKTIKHGNRFLISEFEIEKFIDSMNYNADNSGAEPPSPKE